MLSLPKMKKKMLQSLKSVFILPNIQELNRRDYLSLNNVAGEERVNDLVEIPQFSQLGADSQYLFCRLTKL